MKHCIKKDDVPPSTRHYAVVRFTTIHIEGDERSRTNPGHGYAAEDRPVAEYLAFDNPEDLQHWLDRNHTDNNFVVILAETKSVTVRTTVEVG